MSRRERSRAGGPWQWLLSAPRATGSKRTAGGSGRDGHASHSGRRPPPVGPAAIVRGRVRPPGEKTSAAPRPPGGRRGAASNQGETGTDRGATRRGGRLEPHTNQPATVASSCSFRSGALRFVRSSPRGSGFPRARVHRRDPENPAVKAGPTPLGGLVARRWSRGRQAGRGLRTNIGIDREGVGCRAAHQPDRHREDDEPDERRERPRGHATARGLPGGLHRQGLRRRLHGEALETAREIGRLEPPRGEKVFQGAAGAAMWDGHRWPSCWRRCRSRWGTAGRRRGNVRTGCSKPAGPGSVKGRGRDCPGSSGPESPGGIGSCRGDPRAGASRAASISFRPAVSSVTRSARTRYR